MRKRSTPRLLVTTLFTFLLLTLMLPSSGKAQVTGSKAARAEKSAPAKVMILGTFHFEGAPSFNDVLAAEQQSQIRAIVDSMARFQPTKIALEEEPKDAFRLDSLYQFYQAGRHDLARNECQQLGFRIAERFDHSKLYPIDHKEPWPNQKAVAWARQHQPAFLDYYSAWRQRRAAKDDSLHRNASIREILCHLNTRQYLSRLEALRMRKLELGGGARYPGIAPVRSMYERDFHIFANLTRIAKPGDRVLVIYGSGHVYHLRRFVRDHPNLRLVDPLDYL